MEFTTTVKEFPTQVQLHHLSADAEIRVIVEAKQAEQKSPYIQIGDKAAFEEFKAVDPELGARLASDIIYEHRKP